MISYETIQKRADQRGKTAWRALAGMKKPPRGWLGMGQGNVQPASAGSGLALEGGTVVRALFITMDRKL
jgi:hypothetical protein